MASGPDEAGPLPHETILPQVLHLVEWPDFWHPALDQAVRELVGQDEQGNRYYRTRGGAIDPTLGFERRWVIYNGYAEASRIPPSWHGWIHHVVDVPPTEANYQPREWEKPHQPNLTGTAKAYRPSGSTLASGRRPKATGDYQPWTPG